jgi:hypothetical protein
MLWLPSVQEIPPRMDSGRAFLDVPALLFAANAAATIAWYTSMSAMDEMPMPGG